MLVITRPKLKWLAYGNWYTSSHAYVGAAGTHVRSAATLGGNIALGRLRDLESDVITLFMGAGASVQVISKSSSRSACTLHQTSW